MKAHDVGSVIVKLNDKPVGIITERDILLKVVGEGKDPKKSKSWRNNVITAYYC